MEEPLISIITINYNNKVGLIKTIDSVLTQSFKNYEFIIIDGLSTDGSIDVIEQHNNKFTFSVSEKDNGVYDAMNKGIKHAAGKYLFFLNSGDSLVSTDVLKKVSAAMLQKNNDFFYGNILHGNTIIRYQPNISLYYLLNIGICHQAQFFKRNLFDKLGLYNTNYKITADSVHLMLCFVRLNITYSYLNVVIASIEPDGLSMQALEQNREERKRFMQTELSILQDDYKGLQMYKKINIFERGKNLVIKKFFTR